MLPHLTTGSYDSLGLTIWIQRFVCVGSGRIDELKTFGYVLTKIIVYAAY